MKQTLLAAICLIALAAPAFPLVATAQSAQNPAPAQTAVSKPDPAAAPAFTFGYINYNKVLRATADYALARQTMQNLRQQYDKEASYNEDKFFKMYSDYIQGQKSFPQDIMLKRQKELQVAMDQGIAFRRQSEQTLAGAEEELLEPIRQKLDAAIATVAKEKGYAFVLNTEGNACPYINPLEGTDITLMVEAVLSGKPVPKDAVSAQPEAAQEQQPAAPATPATSTFN